MEKSSAIVRIPELSKTDLFRRAEKGSVHGVEMYRVMPFAQDLLKSHHLQVTQGSPATCQIRVLAEVEHQGQDQEEV